MNLKMIEMPKEEAQGAFEEYRHAIRSAKTSQTNAEDAQIARCYKALAEDRRVINLDDTMGEAGEDEKGLPRLAISRADEQRLHLRRNWGTGDADMYPDSLAFGYRSHVYAGRVFQFPKLLSQREPPLEFTRLSWNRQSRVPINDFRAIIPNIPPHFRPPHNLKNYHLLWEPKWELVPRPPRDPALLKHLGGPLYAVLATWDLTPVEQAVLGVTRN